MQYGQRAQGVSSSLRGALKQIRGWLLAVAVFSAVINVLYLTASIYMLQVYDRVLTSRSVPTLIGISLIAFAAFVLQGMLDGLRGRMLARIGIRFDELTLSDVYRVVVSLPLRGVRPSDAVRPVRDLDQVRMFLSGMGPAALFDIPFMPLFLFVAFLLHPALGWLTLAGGAAILGLTLLTEYRSQEPARTAAEEAAIRNGMVEGVCRNAESLFALGMRSNLGSRFAAASARQNAAGLSGSDVTSGIGAVAKVLRMTLQSASLGLGAYLVIHGEMSAGSIIAASIVTSRALAPIETAVAHWRSFVSARQGYARLKDTLERIPPEPARMSLPAPRSTLQVENIVAFAPGRGEPVLTGISLLLRAGESLGIIGPSGGGKSTLARTMVGIWPVAKGQITLDGASLSQWSEELGQHVGYLSQTMELFDGSIAENISRFATDWSPEVVVAAAKAAGAHEMIVALAEGYDTVIGEGGSGLSGGQRQRIALARALYNDPFLVVLDEPNANLDREGDIALTKAIRSITARGGVAVIITHRPTGLAAVDRVAILQNGRITKLGPRDEVLSAVATPTNERAPAKPPHVRLAVDPQVKGSVS